MLPFFCQVILSTQNVFLFVGLLGLVWSCFLFTHKRGNVSANTFLGILVLVLSIFLLRRAADFQEGGILLLFYFVSHGFVFLIGPSIYFHIASITDGPRKFKDIWLHLLPSLFAIIILGLLYAFRHQLNDPENIELLKPLSIGYITLQVLHVIGYILSSRKRVAQYVMKQEAHYSSLSRINTKWIKRLIILSIVLGVGILIIHFLIVSGGYYEINNTADALFLVLLSIIIFSIIYTTWRQPEIISGIYSEKQKYLKSALSDKESQQLIEKLNQVILGDKAFLIHELNIKELAERMETSPHMLSQLINEIYHENFFHFVNGHRVDYAIQKIKQGDLRKMTMEAVAYESGFNSKTTFNRAFKRKMNCSPKEFHKSIQ